MDNPGVVEGDIVVLDNDSYYAFQDLDGRMQAVRSKASEDSSWG